MSNNKVNWNSSQLGNVGVHPNDWEYKASCTVLLQRTTEVPHGFPLMLSIPSPRQDVPGLPWTFAFTGTFLPPNTSNCIAHVHALSIKLTKIPLWLWFPSRGTYRTHRSLGTVTKSFPWVESDLWFAFDKQHAVVLIWIPTIYPWDSLRGKLNTCVVVKDSDEFSCLSWTSIAVLSLLYGFGFQQLCPWDHIYSSPRSLSEISRTWAGFAKSTWKNAPKHRLKPSAGPELQGEHNHPIISPLPANPESSI